MFCKTSVHPDSGATIARVGRTYCFPGRAPSQAGDADCYRIVLLDPELIFVPYHSIII